MIKKKYHHHNNKYGCILIIISAVFFLIITIRKQVSLSQIIFDYDEEKSGLTVQYYDQDMTNNSFISFTKFNPDLLKTTAFKTDLTTSKWEPKKMRELVKNQSNVLNNKCQRCGTEYLNPSSNSSKRDLVISCFYDLSFFKLRYISALRSVGCQATIVLFVSHPANELNPSLKKITDNCGVIVFQIDDITGSYNENKEVAFHILFHEFLKEYRSDFDRVIIMDPSSIIAQSDPFTTYFTYPTVAVTTTNYNDHITIEQADPINSIDTDYSTDFYEKKGPYLSSILLYGSVDGMLMFYGIIFSHKDFADSRFNPNNKFSVYINYFYHTGLFEKKGLKLFVAIEGSFICSIDKTEDLKAISKAFYGSPFDVKRKIFFTSTYYRERHVLSLATKGMNPPALIGISENDPFHAIHYLSCSNYKYIGGLKRPISSPKKKLPKPDEIN